MSKELLEQRIELAKAYAKCHEAVGVSREKCAEAKNAIVVFDAKHPEVMQTVATEAGIRKRAARAAERKAAGLDPDPPSKTHTAEGDATLPTAKAKGG